MPAQPSMDVLLPKHVTDSCYASLTQIYRDMFELTPKSSLKPSNSNRLSFMAPQTRTYGMVSGVSTESVIHEMYQEPRRAPLSRLFSIGSTKKNASANINNYPFYSGDNGGSHFPQQQQQQPYHQQSQNYYYGDKETRRSDRRFDKNYYYGNYGENFDKKSRMRASWHEGDTKKSVVGTKIEFVTKL